ncbi:ABC transporter ATP-binding protein [bacterium]|nr:ABC transporter ATP-binding protein [bacterium]
MIEISGLTKRFGSLVAVNNLSLTIPRGEFFGFLGPNGAGKTTTIKMMVGLLRPTSGYVRLGGGDGRPGYDVETDPIRAKRIIGYIPDSPYLYEKLSGNEFLEFIGGLYEIPRKLLEQRAEHYLRLFNLTEYADNLIESYSHGMRQKLVMAAALVHEPEVLIVDEPMIGLDPRSASRQDHLRRRPPRGTTLFLSTHSLDVAEVVRASASSCAAT